MIPKQSHSHLSRRKFFAIQGSQVWRCRQRHLSWQQELRPWVLAHRGTRSELGSSEVDLGLTFNGTFTPTAK